MTLPTKYIRILMIVATVSLLIALLLPLGAGAQSKNPLAFLLAPGDDLLVTCETALTSKIENQRGVLKCAPAGTTTPTVTMPAGTTTATATTPAGTTTPTATTPATPTTPVEPGVTGFKGVAENQVLSGTVNIEALVTTNSITDTRVMFRLDGPRRKTHVENRAPFFFGGDQNNKPIGWNTARYPDGNYTLTAVSMTKGGLGKALKVSFQIKNGSAPIETPTASATTAPTQTATPAPTTAVPPVTSTTVAPSVTSTTVVPTATKVVPTPTSKPGNSSFAEQVVALTNKEREKNSCPALTVNDKLTAAAQGHSNDMAVKNFFSHTGSNGSSMGDRITAAGYNFRAAAENIAAGQRTAEEVVKGWMNSPGHRANILNCGYKEIGVGYATHQNSNNTPYWTQNFGTPQ